MQLERLFQYDDWANREEVTRLRDLNIPPAVRLLGHLIGAEWLWITRIRNENAKMAVWPELTVDQCAAELDPLRDSWREILQTVDRESKVDYKNSKGERWSSSVDDILTHVVMHGTYHRGQIATVVRQGGETPAYTDYIHAARTGHISG
ncbi:MAG TPA: DinB family protein [Thermoanaerobaculia bacterium]